MIGFYWQRFRAGLKNLYQLVAKLFRRVRPGLHHCRLRHQGRSRTFSVYIPSCYTPKQEWPLVLLFHGGFHSGQQAMAKCGMNETAEKYGFLVVYPDGTGRVQGHYTWNGGNCCGYARKHNVDDVGFVKKMVAQLNHRFSVDRRRIYATGISNGAMLTYRLANELSDIITAIAPVAGTMAISRFSPMYPVSVLHIHGLKDENIPFAGGRGARSRTRIPYRSIPKTVRMVCERYRCTVPFKRESSSPGVHETWYETADDVIVGLITLENFGHGWPGGAASFVANDRIWHFFVATSRRCPPRPSLPRSPVP